MSKRLQVLLPDRDMSEIQRLATNTYISPNMVAQSLVFEFCSNGDIDRSIATVSRALEERSRLLADALRREIPGCSLRTASTWVG